MALHRLSKAFSSQPLSSTIRFFSSGVTSASPSSEPNLMAAVILERLPVVLPAAPDWEIEYQNFSFQRRQNFNKQYPQQFLDMAASSRSDEEGDIHFDPSPTVTEADKINDVRSVNRSLDKRLYLIIKSKHVLSGKVGWHFPEAEYSNEDTMRQCAEKALASNLGTAMDVYFVGNAPCGHMASSDSSSINRFYFRSQLISGSLLPRNTIEDYAWVTKDEIGSYVDKDSSDFFQKLLI